MKTTRGRLRGHLVLLLAGLIVQFGCASGGNPASVQVENPRTVTSGHQLWAAIDFSWDEVSENLSVVPNRTIEKHWNVTPWLLPDYVKLHIVSWNPVTRVLVVNATLENPFKVDGYDVRGILTNLGDASHLNPDDYTKLYDPHNPPVANPFRAFAKEEMNRKFWGSYSLPEQHIKTETYEIYFPDAVFASFIVTASYPGNADEPYDIVSIDQDGQIIGDQGSITVTAEVLDWQDVTAHHVTIEPNPVTVGSISMTKIGATTWEATVTNVGDVPSGDYEVWMSAWDQFAQYALYNKFTIHVYAVALPWSDPILVSGDTGNEILPRIVLSNTDCWIIYTNENDVLARRSMDGGYTWSTPTVIGTYPDVDTIHAVLGGDDCIYVQYQKSDVKNTFLSKYDNIGWSAPIQVDIMGMTVPPYSCDFGFAADGTLLHMWTGDWSTFGFTSDNPYDFSSWTFHSIGPFYNAVYSRNDGFVQGAVEAKLFYIHEETQLDWAKFDGSWTKDYAYIDNEALIEPAIAPESDGPYHCVMGFTRSGKYDIQYFQFSSWPPSTPDAFPLASGLATEPVFHSVSVEGDFISILFDADGEVRYIESDDGGVTFGPPEVIAGGAATAMYSHVRRDQYSGKVVAAYAQQVGGEYNIYVRIKS